MVQQYRPSGSPFLKTGETQVRILQTTDVHMHLLAFDYFSGRPNPRIGLSRTATLIKTARSEVTNSLLFDTGDFLQGNLLGDKIAYHDEGDTRTHPAIAAMNALRYDGVTLGNHEFSYGVDFLLDALISALFPLMLANVARELGDRPHNDRTMLPPYRIVEKQLRGDSDALRTLKLGLIGFLPPQTGVWERHHTEGHVHFRDVVETARDYVPMMRAEGADLIVALAHSGIAVGDERQEQENAVVPLSRVDGIDVILCGHQHRLFPGSSFAGIHGVDVDRGTINGKPVMMPGFWGSHLGVMDLALQQDASGNWQLRRHKTELRPISTGAQQSKVNETIAQAPEIVRAVRPHHQATLDYMRRPVAQTRTPLHSFFSLVADCAVVQLVARAQADHVAEALRGTRHEGLPILSASAPFKAGGHPGPEYFTYIEAGPLTLGNLADLYLFPNVACALRLTGRDITEWLERCAGLFHRISPGLRQQALHDPQFPSYNFDHLIGLEYEIDPSQPARYSPEGGLVAPDSRRITLVTWQGRPVDPDQEFIVATNSFRASGGGGFLQVAPEDMALQSTRPVRDILSDYLRRKKTIEIRPAPIWRLRPLPGTSALFKTSPRAVDMLNGLRRREARFDSISDDGFAVMQLDF
ncbi:MAG: bifunctional 2',3'-cyclic-nucleotide 2'-phosphodiesterase/3'-nucleotidase [Thalassovita sp.]|nr:bifunctional 2',3'-cyclic-nucleotide 2'-phosphodiesterase/3'-nucleotidase [Thalassovita sp.]